MIGPGLAFILGVLAVYIKHVIDRRLDIRNSNTKFKKLFILIRESAPPKKYYPGKAEKAFHADQARNLTNLSIFKTRLNILEMYIEKIEDDVMINCGTTQIQQFNQIKFIVSYIIRDIEVYRNGGVEDSKEKDKSFPYIEHLDFIKLKDDYNRIINVCNNPRADFQYIEG